MKVLVACERSGRVREAFRKHGHDAYSCDLVKADDYQTYHLKENALDVIHWNDWNLLIAHPPCTYLSRAGGRWLYPNGEMNGERYQKLLKARQFFMALWESNIPKIAIENPTPFLIADLPQPTQILQPHEYGEPFTKRTLLWLKGLAPLIPTNRVKPNGSWLPSNTSGFRKGQKHQRGKAKQSEYSLTFQGIADAMGEQWNA